MMEMALWRNKRYELGGGLYRMLRLFHYTPVSIFVKGGTPI